MKASDGTQVGVPNPEPGTAVSHMRVCVVRFRNFPSCFHLKPTDYARELPFIATAVCASRHALTVLDCPHRSRSVWGSARVRAGPHRLGRRGRGGAKPRDAFPSRCEWVVLGWDLEGAALSRIGFRGQACKGRFLTTVHCVIDGVVKLSQTQTILADSCGETGLYQVEFYEFESTL